MKRLPLITIGLTLSAIVTFLALNLYESEDQVLNTQVARTSTQHIAARTDSQASTSAQQYVGSDTCGGCHTEQQKLWSGSYHDKAMAHANTENVKGDFNNQQLTALNHVSRFYQSQDKYWVSTQGPDGKLAEYEVLYTLGTHPLQQYIVSFPGGRLQMLPLAWDTIKKKWFHLQEQQQPVAGEWIHWTQGGMNWNSMCADCHTTNSIKNFDPDSKTYNTSWTDMNVGCESCHGPGQAHTDAMQKGESFDPSLLDMNGSDTSPVLVDKCGRCHARRQQLTEVFKHDSNTLLDHYLPEILQQGLYHADGQIQDEVFVYGSFTQSKMYQNGVSCNNCHNPHSTQIKKPGNEMCTTCHLPSSYDTPEHHHHDNHVSRESDESNTGTGDWCVDCHMPSKIYMGNDFRRDHSLRIPRPDLSVKHQTPNACRNCHQQQTDTWAAEAVESWFGQERPSHFSEVLTAARQDPSRAINPLIEILNNKLQPAISRATAAHILAPLASGNIILEALQQALVDESPLLRATIANSFYDLPIQIKTDLLAPLLADKVRAVRIAAAHSLIEVSPMHIDIRYRKALIEARKEYQQSLAQNMDFSYGNVQMGLDADKRNQPQKAITFYNRALEIDSHNNNTRMNLAHLLYRQKRIDEAEQLFRKIIQQEPNAAPALYALGLLLAEKKDLEGAEEMLERAAKSGGNARTWYNLAVLRHQQQKYVSAEANYQTARSMEPSNPEFVLGLVSLYAQQQQWDKVEPVIEKAIQESPNDPQLQALKQSLLTSNPK